MASGAKVTAIKIILFMVIPPNLLTYINYGKAPYKLVTIKVVTPGWIFFPFISGGFNSEVLVLLGHLSGSEY